MTQKQISIFSPIFLICIALIIILLKISNNSLHQDLQELKIENLSSISFYKDFLRDSSGLDLELTDPDDLNDLLFCLNNIEKTSNTVKSQTIIEEVRIHLSIQTDKSQSLELHIMRTEEMGDVALITIGIIKGSGSFNGGVYRSDHFLPWLISISGRPGYDVIWE
ncbi:MAG: hypothetical protein JEY99_04440 [Spirochaetales bacterium]|nr:hypothetical protein [Spirochaetales bacterium]